MIEWITRGLYWHALNTMSMALARVLGPEIRVLVVAPGMVHTG
jgi:NAD(P)-dependent dehydrogenase (short-subunit alcohol dehydrogenase family)